jgi:hypothetical protein
MAGIDRDYWLDFAKDGVSKGIQSREDAAEKLDTFLTWVWGIYTSIFALASLLNYMSGSIWQLVFVSQPVLIIMLSRFACKLVQMPSLGDKANADPNVVPEIIDGYILIVKDKKRKLRNAVLLTLVSILSICIALVGYNLFDADKDIKHSIQQMKLEKELHDQVIAPVKPQQTLNDSIKSVNDYYDLQVQNEIKRRKLGCMLNHDQKCLDSIKLLEK